MAREYADSPDWLVPCVDKLLTLGLISVNIFLAGYAGAGLATAARLRYDPGTQAVAKQAFPEHLELVSRMLPLASGVLMGLAALAPAALAMPRCLRCFLLTLYAVGMLGAAGAEVWLAVRARDEVQRHLRESQQTVDTVVQYLYFALGVISSFHSYAWTVMGIVQDVSTNLPKNVVVAKQALVYFLALQVTGGVLAVAAIVSGKLRTRARFKQA